MVLNLVVGNVVGKLAPRLLYGMPASLECNIRGSGNDPAMDLGTIRPLLVMPMIHECRPLCWKDRSPEGRASVVLITPRVGP